MAQPNKMFLVQILGSQFVLIRIFLFHVFNQSMRGIMPINIHYQNTINLIILMKCTSTSDMSHPYFAKHKISFEFFFSSLFQLYLILLCIRAMSSILPINNQERNRKTGRVKKLFIIVFELSRVEYQVTYWRLRENRGLIRVHKRTIQ